MSGLNIRVTIGLCVKNAERTIHNCLESIAKQTYAKELMDIIIVDGRSKDKTVEIAKEVVFTSKIKSEFFSDDGNGLGTARQIVLENTDNKYVVFVDGDIEIFPNFVEKQIEFMEKNPPVCVATGKQIDRKDIRMSLPESLESLDKYIGSTEYTAQERGIPPNDASIYRVEASKQVGGFDTNIRGAGEDVDIMTRMRERGWLIAVNKNAKYYAFPRTTWLGVWLENVWFGYGSHFLCHKHKDLHLRTYSIPIVYLYVGLKKSLKAYKLTSEKKYFIFPFSYAFSKVAWWYGFVQAHLEDYGHKNQHSSHQD